MALVKFIVKPDLKGLKMEGFGKMKAECRSF